MRLRKQIAAWSIALLLTGLVVAPGFTTFSLKTANASSQEVALSKKQIDSEDYTNYLALLAGGGAIDRDPQSQPLSAEEIAKLRQLQIAFNAESNLVANGVCTINGTTGSGSVDRPSMSGAQLGRIFRDAIPSTCPSKVYPGIFNVSTTYNYDAYTFTNSSSMAVCVTINFDPNSGGITPCGTNAHAIAYLGSYDPNNQPANYVGDVGSSITQPFSFQVSAGQNFVVVVTNTASQASCNYSFSLDSSFCQLFDTCIQDDSAGYIQQINTETGEYQFTNCNGVTAGGTGTVTRKGCTITLQHNAPDRRILTKVDNCQKKATSSIRLLSPGSTFSITDRNITNNLCACAN